MKKKNNLLVYLPQLLLGVVGFGIGMALPDSAALWVAVAVAAATGFVATIPHKKSTDVMVAFLTNPGHHTEAFRYGLPIAAGLLSSLLF